MADQKKWFKVWSTILIDPHHANMSLEDVGRWTRLGAMIVSSGEAGELKIIPPAKPFLVAMDCPDLNAAKSAIKMLPNTVIEEGRNDNGSFTVIMKNWFKYQVDSTAYDRLKRSRCKRRGEEKRVEEIRSTPVVPKGTGPKVQEWFEKTWQAYPRERRIGKKAAFRSYQRVVKTLEDAIWVGRALDNYLKSKTVLDGYIKNASTFFANTEDYGDERRNIESSNGQAAESGATPAIPGNGINPSVKQIVDGLGNSFPGGSSKDRLHGGSR